MQLNIGLQSVCATIFTQCIARANFTAIEKGMLFHSFTFLFAFLPLVWLAYMALRNTRLRPFVLIISGYVFYAWGSPWIASLLFLSSTVDFTLGLLMEKADSKRCRRLLLLVSLIFNLGLLAIFKYSSWAFEAVNHVLKLAEVSWQLPVISLPLPPGISFYTFQSLSYIIDIYRRKLHAHKRLADYYAFVAFFPQLFAGPIERAGHLLPQIVHAPRVHPRMFESGVFLIVWGLFKKLVVADNMANLTELCQANMSLSGAGIVLLLAFTVQIYADFSGYTDIARGCARLFGIKLRRNFLTPYMALNPTDFWRRWHISLSSWIRDYLYVPLGGNRAGKWVTLRNLIITMGLAGLWHGASVYFILWGLYHGMLLALYRLVPIDRLLPAALARLLMFGFVVLGWGLFYAGSHGSLSRIFFPTEIPAATLPVYALWYGLFLFSLPVALTDWLAFRKHREFSDLWPHFGRWLKVTVLVVLFYGIVLLGARDSHEFIYFQF